MSRVSARPHGRSRDLSSGLRRYLMMTVSNSKPWAVGASRSQPDGGVYSQSQLATERQAFVPPIGRISAPEIPLCLASANNSPFLSADYCPSHTSVSDSTHIASTGEATYFGHPRPKNRSLMRFSAGTMLSPSQRRGIWPRCAFWWLALNFLSGPDRINRFYWADEDFSVAVLAGPGSG